MESVAIVTGITIFIAVMLALGGPELLRWQAGRNRDRHELLLPAQEALATQLRETAAELRDFRPLRAEIYQEKYADTRKRMEGAVNAFRAAQQQQETLRLPTVDEDGLAIQFFLKQPQHMATIPRDMTRLGRLQRLLTRARHNLAEVREGLETLTHIPADLQMRSRTVSNRDLRELATLLATEEEAGIEGLAAWRRRREELAEEAQTLAQLLRREPNQPLSQMDALAQALARIESATMDLSAEVEELVDARQVVDGKLERTRVAFERLAEGADAVPAPLLIRSKRVLETAEERRRSAAFADAGEALVQAQALLALASDLASVGRRVTMLEKFTDVSLEAAQIAELSQAHSRAQGLVKERLGPAGDEEAGSALLAPAEMQVVDRLQRQAREMEARAERLLALHQTQVQELEEEATREQQALGRAWQELVQLMPPAAGDPLANRYELLERQRTEATGKPALLRAYVGAARGLATRLADTARYLDDNLRWASGLRDEISELLARAEAEAGEWHSLQSLVTEIRESAAAIWQLDPAAAGTLEEAYDALDELQAQQERALDAWEALQAGRQRMRAVEERIERAEAALEGAEVDPVEWQRVEQLAHGYYADARQAETVDGAVLALQEMHKVLQDVVMRS